MKNASIYIESITRTSEGSDESNFFTQGAFEKNQDEYRISYNENAEIGYENSSVSITASSDKIIVERSGAVTSVLYIERGKKHHCVYGTPYGDFSLGTNAYDIRCALTENGGELYFKYSIDINSEYISENELTLKISIN